MKKFKLILWSVLALFIVSTCQRDDILNEETLTEKGMIKMVPFKGSFKSFPIDVVMADCIDPDVGVSIPGPVFNAVSGNATHLGKLDSSQSPLTILECSLDAANQSITTMLDITLVNKKGDGVRFLGESNLSLLGPATGSFEIIEGFGKFDGATGWMNTVGFFNAELGTTVFSGEGKITQPNH